MRTLFELLEVAFAAFTVVGAIALLTLATIVMLDEQEKR